LLLSDGKTLTINGVVFLKVLSERPVSDGHYLQVRLAPPSELQGLLLWIPHHYVAMAFADEQKRQIGFLDA